MSGLNCSYSALNGTYIPQLCTSTSQLYCCQSAGTKYCTDSECSSSSSSNSSSSGVAAKTIAFWGILGGLFILVIIVIVLVYVMCYKRQPTHGCFSHNPMDELFETTIQVEEHTVTSETQMTGNSIRRTEKIRKVITKQQSRNNLFQSKTMEPMTIRVSPQTMQAQSSREFDKLVSDKRKLGQRSISPRPGQSQTTSIGNTG